MLLIYCSVPKQREQLRLFMHTYVHPWLHRGHLGGCVGEFVISCPATTRPLGRPSCELAGAVSRHCAVQERERALSDGNAQGTGRVLSPGATSRLCLLPGCSGARAMLPEPSCTSLLLQSPRHPRAWSRGLSHAPGRGQDLLLLLLVKLSPQSKSHGTARW